MPTMTGYTKYHMLNYDAAIDMLCDAGYGIVTARGWLCRADKTPGVTAPMSASTVIITADRGWYRITLVKENQSHE